jgi:hypothetical protein
VENRAYLGCWPGAYDGAALVSFNDSLGHDYYRFYYNFPVRPRAIIELTTRASDAVANCQIIDLFLRQNAWSDKMKSHNYYRSLL